MFDNKVHELLLGFMDNDRAVEKKDQLRISFFCTMPVGSVILPVIDRIEYRKGAWEISLIFSHYQNPLQLIVRRIVTCPSEQKAELVAFYLRRQAAKDPRGTLEVTIKDFSLCPN
jgi:hypothetical protein